MRLFLFTFTAMIIALSPYSSSAEDTKSCSTQFETAGKNKPGTVTLVCKGKKPVTKIFTPETNKCVAKCNDRLRCIMGCIQKQSQKMTGNS